MDALPFIQGLQMVGVEGVGFGAFGCLVAVSKVRNCTGGQSAQVADVLATGSEALVPRFDLGCSKRELACGAEAETNHNTRSDPFGAEALTSLSGEDSLRST